ncbi:TRAP-type C4-dicarboxylate transport system permease small subunit [Aestuariispira insulae]|uniref:TRAP transporter small permease protein n=2 Tax=Aestuariispira insulae TaxID=1461337 RepID=A0A3D9HJM3_9PROT|nr:TRAP-type C4-dicarboxylate transport system permease small subunit [Aestuariispira insulae]
MRSILDMIYKASEYLAAAFLLAIGVMVLAQVGCNIANSLVGWMTGVNGEYAIPSYAEFAGFFLAASSFLALAGTFRAGVHIRVSLVIQNFAGTKRRIVELWCVGLAILMVGFFGWHMLQLVLESLEYMDMSPGLIPVPLWIPQSALALGLLVFLMALLDAFAAVLGGEERAHGDPELSESGE